MTLIEVVPPRGLRSDEERISFKPNKEFLKYLNDRFRGFSEPVCHVTDSNYFNHKEWLLELDGDVSCHKYWVWDNIIYVTVYVEV